MKATLLALAVSCATPALAQYGPPAPISFVDAEGPATQPETPAQRIDDDRSLIEKIGPRKLAAFTLVNAYDKLTTRRCIHKRTCEEAGLGMNAMWGKRPKDIELVGAFAVDQALYVGGSVLFGEAFGYSSTATRVFQIGMIGSRGVIGTMNLRF